VYHALITISTNFDFAREVGYHELDRNMADFTTGQVWGALRKAWKGYRIAKVQHDNARMVEYATRIRTLQGQLGVPPASFPDLGM
jgi:hypothetical protein